MTSLDITTRIANIHNILSKIMVSGDNAIAMGSVLVDLRQMVVDLQNMTQTEDAQEEK